MVQTVYRKLLLLTFSKVAGTIHFLPSSVFLKENICFWSMCIQTASPYPRSVAVMYDNKIRKFWSFLFWDLVHDPAGAGLHVRVDHGPAGLCLSGADWPGPQQLPRFHLHKGIVTVVTGSSRYTVILQWYYPAVFRIHDILGWIRIRILGSMLLTSGSGSCYFRHWPSRCQKKTNF